MGRSAKTHKRVKRTASGVPQAHHDNAHNANQNTNKVAASGSSLNAPPSAKRRANLKNKAMASKKNGGGSGGRVLGGADYVELMMGGRRKAAAEAKKLPKS